MKTSKQGTHIKAVVRWLISVAAGLCLVQANAQPSSLPETRFWQPDGPVRAIVVKGRTVYIGGQFGYVGPASGGAGIVDPITGIAKRSFPLVVGAVYAATPDGTGGWYIGGSFSSVGGIVRSNLARISADNLVDPTWNPNANNSCLAILRIGNTVYAGGSFTRVGGWTRNRIAALDGATGGPTAWNANANQTVNALATDGNNIYVAGNFTSIGGQSRSRLAALDTASGLATSWNPGANNTVNALAISGTTLYIGGNFTTAGTKPRNRIAALSLTSSVALDWNPNAGAAVNALAVAGDVVYAGGQFTVIGGQNRKFLAALDNTTGLATGWNPAPDGTVNTLALSTTNLFAGGAFTNADGQLHGSLVRFDTTTGMATPWNPSVSRLRPNSSPESLLIVAAENEVFVAGDFVSLGGLMRTNLAALDTVTGEPTAWDPNANGQVTALAADDVAVYAGGGFTSIAGMPRMHLAALDPISGLPTTWTANVSGRSTLCIFALVVNSTDRLYVGGNFTNVSGQARNSLAAVGRAAGGLTAWNPNARAASDSTSASVNALVLTTNAVYVGGDFVNVGGQPRQRIAALNPDNGAATVWNPGTDNTVSALALDEGNLYVGGLFTSIGGLPRGRIAALDTTTGVPTIWNPDVAGSSAQVRSLVVAGSSVYVGGQFTQIGGEFRNRAAGVRLDSARSHHWNPDLNGQVRMLYRTGTGIYAGGEFTSAGDRPSAYFVCFSAMPAFAPETVRRQENGAFSATLRSGEGDHVVVQASADLESWFDLCTNSITGFPMVFEHAQLPGAPCLFYRAVLQPD